MKEKIFELDRDTNFVEKVLMDSEIDKIVRNASEMKINDVTGYMQFAGWERRENDYYFSTNGNPIGYQITSAEALYCDIKKADDHYVLYILEDGKFLSNDTNERILTTDSLDKEELKQCFISLIDDTRKDVYRDYNIKTSIHEGYCFSRRFWNPPLPHNKGYLKAVDANI